jgi:hypothetical protein
MVGCINGCPDRPANRPVCEEHTIRIIMEVFGRARHGWGQSERLCLIVQKSLFLGLKMMREGVHPPQEQWSQSRYSEIIEAHTSSHHLAVIDEAVSLLFSKKLSEALEEAWRKVSSEIECFRYRLSTGQEKVE